MLTKPSTVLPGLQRLLVAVVSLVLHLQVAGRFPIKTLYNKEFIASTGYAYRFFFLYMALFGDRYVCISRTADGKCPLLYTALLFFKTYYYSQ